jgi:hypothetical protein
LEYVIGILICVWHEKNVFINTFLLVHLLLTYFDVVQVCLEKRIWTGNQVNISDVAFSAMAFVLVAQKSV